MIHLRSHSVSVVIDYSSGVPAIVHWGGPLDDDRIDGALFDGPVLHGALDVVAALSVVPEHGSGYVARPGLEGSRVDGSDWSPRFTGAGEPAVNADRTRATFECVDVPAALQLHVELSLEPSGVLTTRATLTNIGNNEYRLGALRVTLPLPGHAVETMTMAGRWALEWQPVRDAWPSGTIAVENRGGRTSHDRPPIGFAGSSGFSEQNGEVWGVHLAWSGNTAVHFDAPSDGRRSTQCEELLSPGEIVLSPGASYTTPRVCAAYSGAGLNGVSQAFHRYARTSPTAPTTARPVTLNTWEAIYFDHDEAVVRRLADRAAAVGIERFVLDDGWFHGRRNDHAGLGDWWIDAAVWPNGLAPVIEHVRALGMQFGIWIEPEMVNPDSDLYRAHPDWALTDARYEPVLGRQQLVLDLTRPEVSTYLFERIDAVLSENDILYVKWDMNRSLLHASHDRRAAVHGQTMALYALLDRLRAAHPAVEFESCASGGGRVDLEILDHTSRFWTSDCNDSLDRQQIQRGYSYVFPPERMGAHIGPSTSHTTGRTHSLAFRAITAMFGHFGVEWNLLDLGDDDLVALTDLIALHKELRPLLHDGEGFRLDHPNPTVLAHGVYAYDRREAIVTIAQLESPRTQRVEPLRMPGLLDDVRYDVSIIPVRGAAPRAASRQPRWVADGLVATGRQLAVLGVPMPSMWPESAVLIRVRAR